MTDDPRIAWVKRPNRWVKYRRAQMAMQRLEQLYNAPQADRMRNLLIVGETNNGKTAIVRYFEKLYPREFRPDEDVSNVPVLLIQAPALADEGRFYDAILSRLYAPFKSSWNVGRRQQQAYAMMQMLNVRMLIVDDVHNLLAGASAKQRILLNTIRHMGNELRISIVCAGTELAFRAIESDAQLGNRFIPFVLPKWKIDDPDYLSLLKAFENDFKLEKPSNLTDAALAIKIATMSEGTIGEIGWLLTEAAELAIENKSECISAKTLDSCGYVPPRERRYLRTG